MSESISPAAPTNILVKVKLLTGDVLLINIAPTASIKDLYLKVQDWSHVPADQQRLIFNGKYLDIEHLGEQLAQRKLCHWYSDPDQLASARRQLECNRCKIRGCCTLFTLAHYGITDKATVHMVLRLNGC